MIAVLDDLDVVYGQVLLKKNLLATWRVQSELLTEFKFRLLVWYDSVTQKPRFFFLTRQSSVFIKYFLNIGSAQWLTSKSPYLSQMQPNHLLINTAFLKKVILLSSAPLSHWQLVSCNLVRDEQLYRFYPRNDQSYDLWLCRCQRLRWGRSFQPRFQS